jgi:hypothetical protein
VFSAVAGEWGKLARWTHGFVPVVSGSHKVQTVFKMGDHERRNGLLDHEDESAMIL